MEKTLSSRKKGKYYYRRQKITFYFSDANIKISSGIRYNTVQLGTITACSPMTAES